MTEPYVARIQLTPETFGASAEAFFKREFPKYAATRTPENGVWVTVEIPGDTDERAGERFYNTLTRLEMDVAMRAGRPVANNPISEGMVLLMQGGRVIAMKEAS